MISMDTLIVQIMNQAQKLVSADRWRDVNLVKYHSTAVVVVVVVVAAVVVCYYSCFQGFSLPCWLKNKPAVCQVWPKYSFQWKDTISPKREINRVYYSAITQLIRIFDVSCDEDTGEMKQGDNAMRCLFVFEAALLTFNPLSVSQWVNDHHFRQRQKDKYCDLRAVSHSYNVKIWLDLLTFFPFVFSNLIYIRWNMSLWKLLVSD